jgi:hypothetical protein
LGVELQRWRRRWWWRKRGGDELAGWSFLEDGQGAGKECFWEYRM